MVGFLFAHIPFISKCVSEGLKRQGRAREGKKLGAEIIQKMNIKKSHKLPFFAVQNLVTLQ